MRFGRVTRAIRLAPLEVSLLFAMLLLLALTMAQTIRVGRDEALRDDLRYTGTLARIDSLIAMATPAGVAKTVRASLVIGLDSMSFDTLAMQLDSAVIPSAAKGGFLADEVSRFNRSELLYATSRASTLTASRPHLGLLSTTEAGGETYLAATTNPFGLLVGSPFTSARNVGVRTSDWGKNPSLVGLRSSTSLRTSNPIGDGDALIAGPWCEVRAALPYGPRQLYCGGVVGSTPGTHYDLMISPLTVWQEPGNVRISFFRPTVVSVNSRQQRLGGLDIKAGDIVHTARIGPFVYSVEENGVLAAEQWINGGNRFVTFGAGTLRPFGRAGRNIQGQAPGSRAIELALDERLTTALDRSTLDFLRLHSTELTRIAAVLVDPMNGAVRALSEQSFGELEPLRSFEPLLVGSIVKPILAAAILSSRPTLHKMTLPYAGETVVSIDGRMLTKGFENHANGCTTQIDFVAFIRCSSNQYAAELVFKSFRTFPKGAANVPQSVLEQSDLANGLARIFDVDAEGKRTTGRLDRTWNYSTAPPAQPASISDRTLIPWESRPWLVFERGKGTPVDWVARYAFGAWENRWTLFGLAEAYSRIATGKEVRLTFRQPALTKDTLFPFFRGDTAQALAWTREALASVPIGGTAAGLTSSLRGALENENLTVLAKTGTLDEASKSRNERGTFIKSLAIAVGNENERSNAIDCGLVIILYFEFRPDWKAVTGRDALPARHVEFARGPLAAVLASNWKRVTKCHLN